MTKPLPVGASNIAQNLCIPKSILRKLEDLSIYSTAVYVRLLRSDGQLLGIRDMMKLTGMSDKTITRARNELIDAGLIKMCAVQHSQKGAIQFVDLIRHDDIRTGYEPCQSGHVPDTNLATSTYNFGQKGLVPDTNLATIRAVSDTNLAKCSYGFMTFSSQDGSKFCGTFMVSEEPHYRSVIKTADITRLEEISGHTDKPAPIVADSKKPQNSPQKEEGKMRPVSRLKNAALEPDNPFYDAIGHLRKNEAYRHHMDVQSYNELFQSHIDTYHCTVSQIVMEIRRFIASNREGKTTIRKPLNYLSAWLRKAEWTKPKTDTSSTQWKPKRNPNYEDIETIIGDDGRVIQF